MGPKKFIIAVCIVWASGLICWCGQQRGFMVNFPAFWLAGVITGIVSVLIGISDD